MTLAVISTDTIEHCYSIDYNKLVDKPGLLCHLNPFLHTQSFLIKCLCSPWVHTHPLTVVLVPNIVDMTCYCEGCMGIVDIRFVAMLMQRISEVFGCVVCVWALQQSAH